MLPAASSRSAGLIVGSRVHTGQARPVAIQTPACREAAIPSPTALVGGGAAGIGYATAARLARAGHRVVITGRRASTLDAAVLRLKDETGGDVSALVHDVSVPVTAEPLVASVEARYGQLDVLVVNAGGPQPGRVLDIDDAGWTRACDLLLLGPLALARAAVPRMAGRGFGRVVFVTSAAVRQPQPDLAASVALRAAVTAAAKLASREYAARGVTVNCVAPGATATERRQEILVSRSRAAGTGLAEADAADTATVPAGRAGSPDEVAAAIAFLASASASYINGTVLTVDGGRTETI
jgi:3-oxoacyl-[acyl-carrier protein] reductase